MREHTGTSIAIGAVSTFAFTIWAGVIAVMLWSGITVYAIVKPAWEAGQRRWGEWPTAPCR